MIRQTIKALWWRSLPALVLGALIAIEFHRGDNDPAGLVFTANATFVALIVPAAALANTLLEGRLLSYLSNLIQLPEEKAAEAAESLRSLATSVVNSVTPLAYGFVFLLVSFGLSILALLHPDHRFWSGHGAFKFTVEDLLLGGALGFDVVGIVLFLPFVWLLLDQDLGTSTLDLIGWQADELAAAKSAQPVAPEVTAAPPDQRPNG